jgi:hypothetical protein
MRRVLGIQDFTRKVLVSDHLEQTQSHNGLDASRGGGVGQLVNDLVGGTRNQSYSPRGSLQRTTFYQFEVFLKNVPI